MEGTTAQEQRRLDAIAASAMTALAVVLYLATAAPTVTFGGDCGELAAAAWSLGIAHPTGYPLYLMLGKLLTLLVPWGEVAWRVALLSVLAGGAAVGLVTLATARLTGDRPAALLAGATLLFARAFWTQAIIAEVYALHLALLALLLWLQVEWWLSRDRRWLNLTGLAYGLACCNHVSAVLWAPATLLFLAVAERRALPGALLRIALWALPCLLLYAYLPLRAALDPPLDWGSADTWAGFLRHVTGREYAGYLLRGEPQEMLRYARNHLLFLSFDIRLALLLALLGLAAGWRLWRPPTALAAAGGLAALLFAVQYRVGDRSNYVLPLYLATAWLTGLGAAGLRRRLFGHRPASEVVAAQALFSAVVLLLPLLPAPPDGVATARAGFDLSNMAGNDRARRLAATALGEVPPGGAVLVISDELGFAMWYLQVVERVRRDVLVHDLGTITTVGGRQRVERVLAEEVTRRPTCLAFYDQTLAQRYRLVPNLATCRVLPRGAAPPVQLGEVGASDYRAFPALPSWSLVSSRVESAVALPPESPASGPAPGLKVRTLARLSAQVMPLNGRAAAAEVVVLLVHASLAQELAGKAVVAPRVVNDSSGRVERWTLARLPFAPTATGYRLGVGRVVTLAWPLALPERSLAGRYDVRVGLIPAGTAALQGESRQTLEAAWRATLPAGSLTSYSK